MRISSTAGEDGGPLQVIGQVPGIASDRYRRKYLAGSALRLGGSVQPAVGRAFDAYVRSLLDAKRLEVCSTSLPQLCIPAIMGTSAIPNPGPAGGDVRGPGEEAAAAFAGIEASPS
jgi:hypothetical protein